MIVLFKSLRFGIYQTGERNPLIVADFQEHLLYQFLSYSEASKFVKESETTAGSNPGSFYFQTSFEIGCQNPLTIL